MLPWPLCPSPVHSHPSCTLCRVWPWSSWSQAWSASHGGKLNARPRSLLEQDLPLGQATIPKRLVCRGLYGSSALSRTALSSPSFIPPGSPCRGRQAVTPSCHNDVINLRRGGGAGQSDTASQCPILCFPSPCQGGPNIQRDLLPCLAAEGLGLTSWCPRRLSQAIYAGPGLCLGVKFKVQSEVRVSIRV